MTTAAPKGKTPFFYIVAALAALVFIGLGVKAVITTPVVFIALLFLAILVLTHKVGLKTLEADAQDALAYVRRQLAGAESALFEAKKKAAQQPVPAANTETATVVTAG